MAVEPLGVPRLFENDPEEGYGFYRDVVECTIAYCDRKAAENKQSLDKLRQDRHPEPEAIARLEHEIATYEDVIGYIILDWLSK